MPCDDAPCLAVVDIGGTHLRLGLTGEAASGCTVEASTDLLREGEPVATLAGLIDRLRSLAEQDVSGVVVGVPGFLDKARRVVVNTPNIPQLRTLELADGLSARCRIPVWLEHDVALLTRGEARAGAARGASVVLGLYFGTGIGGALLVDGQPLDAGPSAMQVGHVPVRGDGRRCPCGGIDCIEPYASGKALAAIAGRFGVELTDIFVRADPPDLCRELGRFVEDQALAVAGPTTLLDPDVVVIGGGVAAMAGYPFAQLAAAVRRRLSPARPRERPALVAAALGWSAVLHGALDVVRHASVGDGRG